MTSLLLNGESGLLQQQTAVVSLLGIAILVAAAAAKLKFPYSVGLVVAGIGASFLGEIVAVDISPELILALLVPPLLFEATLQLPWAKLKADLFPILLLAIGGTLFGTVVMAALVNFGLNIPWAAAFAFGALIAATDPVAVVAFFKSLGVPKRLVVLIEGESLFNDAVAVVAFTLAVSAASGSGFSASEAVTQFVLISAGGLLIGLALGYVISVLFISKIDDAMIETSLTVVTAYGAYLLAEEFGKLVGDEELKLSGILAVVAAGLVVGNVGLGTTSPSTRITLSNFWELLTFFANSMVFLVIGLTITPSKFLDHFGEVILAIVAVVLIRVCVIYGVAYLTRKVRPRRRIPMSFQHVITWGGLRGAISLALALSITIELGYFEPDTVETIQTMTFGVVLFTLLVQGTTISSIIKKLGLANKSKVEVTRQRHQATIKITRSAQKQIDALVAKGDLFEDMGESLKRAHQEEIDANLASLREHFTQNPELEVAMLMQARHRVLAAERSALSVLVRDSSVDSNVAAEIALELNNRAVALEILEDRWGKEVESSE